MKILKLLKFLLWAAGFALATAFVLLLGFRILVWATDTEERTTAFVANRNGLWARNSPSRNGSKITVLPDKSRVQIERRHKETVTIDGRQGQWVYAKFKGGQGWLFDGYLAEDGEITLLEPQLGIVTGTKVDCYTDKTGHTVGRSYKAGDILHLEKRNLRRLTVKGVYGYLFKTDGCWLPDDNLILQKMQNIHFEQLKLTKNACMNCEGYACADIYFEPMLVGEYYIGRLDYQQEMVPQPIAILIGNYFIKYPKVAIIEEEFSQPMIDVPEFRLPFETLFFLGPDHIKVDARWNQIVDAEAPEETQDPVDSIRPPLFRSSNLWTYNPVQKMPPSKIDCSKEDGAGAPKNNSYYKSKRLSFGEAKAAIKKMRKGMELANTPSNQ